MHLTEKRWDFDKKKSYLLNGYGAKRLIKEFPTTGWKKTTSLSTDCGYNSG